MDGLPGMEQLLQEVNAALPCKDFCVEMAINMFKAHRKWLGEHPCADELHCDMS
jgi:hypothetical protein